MKMPLALVLCSTAPCLADIAWDTLGPSNTYHTTTGGTLRGPNHASGPAWTGVQFVAQASGDITGMDIAVVGTTLPNSFSAELWADNNNYPGAMLMEIGFFAGHTNGAPPAHISPAPGGVPVVAGTTYWMVVKGQDAASGAWRRSLLPDPGIRAFSTNLGATWSIFSSDPRYAFRLEVAGGSSICYANCDDSTQTPFLNVADFSCFLTEFAAGSAYANCDESTTEPTLNVADFSCFLTKFAAGCP